MGGDDNGIEGLSDVYKHEAHLHYEMNNCIGPNSNTYIECWQEWAVVY